MQDQASELVFLPLGGVGEIGMNLGLYGIGPADDRSWLMVDCGVTFAGPDLPGVDLVLPDIRFIEAEKHRLLGIVITHAHEDHYGALVELWPYLDAPVYLSPFAAGLLEAKLLHGGPAEIPMNIIKAGEQLTIGPFDLEFIAMSHSIPEPMAVAIRSEHGTVIHTGDWKVDHEPGIGDPIDMDRLGEIGNEGVRALLCDSTNAVREGTSPSEADVAQHLTEIIAGAKRRVAVTAFASNVARIRAVAKAARANDREIVIVGRAMKRAVEVATDLGYMDDMPEFLDEESYGYLPRDKVVALCTGSQGEARAALARIANDDHRHVTLSRGDMVIFSARTIPGNEKAVGAVINGLVDQGMDVVTDRDALVHVSGHPRKGELEQLYQLLKPEMLVPVHGEPLHLEAQAKFARKNGIKDVVAGRNGDIIRLAPGPGSVIDEAPSGILVKDGELLTEPDLAGIQERRKLSFVGVATGYITLNRAGEIQGDPQVVLFGLPESDDEGEDFEDIALDGLEGAVRSIPKSRRRDASIVMEAARRGLRSSIAERWGKKPLCRVVVNVI